jgi:hypothetical protein
MSFENRGVRKYRCADPEERDRAKNRGDIVFAQSEGNVTRSAERSGNAVCRFQLKKRPDSLRSKCAFKWTCNIGVAMGSDRVGAMDHFGS